MKASHLCHITWLSLQHHHPHLQDYSAVLKITVWLLHWRVSCYLLCCVEAPRTAGLLPEGTDLLQRILKNFLLEYTGFTLPTKVCLVKAVVFPVVMYGCELDHKES